MQNQAPETANIPCKICGNTEGNTSYTARELMYGLRHTFPYIQCGACKCLQIMEFPKDMSPYYPSNYYSFREYDGKKFKGVFAGLKRLQYASAVFRNGFVASMMTALFDVADYRIFKGLGITKASRVLDVGCGNGRSFLYPLAEIGFKNAMGCDPYLEKDIVYANGLTIRKASVFEVEGKWDVITYHHSFEHVPNPQENMHAIASKLDSGGVCIIRIPTASSWAWEHYRTNWAQLDAPRHFFLHSQESMRLMAENAGLEVNEVIYDSYHFQFSGSEKYVADTPLTAPRKKGIFNFLNRKWKKRSYTRRAKQLNREGRGDQAAFFLRPKQA